MQPQEQQVASWHPPDRSTYAEVATQLLALALHAPTPELKLQYTQLAALYERLAIYTSTVAHASQDWEDAGDDSAADDVRSSKPH